MLSCLCAVICPSAVWDLLDHTQSLEEAVSSRTVWFHNESALSSLLSDFIIVLCRLHHLQAWGQLFLTISAVPERPMTQGLEDFFFPALWRLKMSQINPNLKVWVTLNVPLWTIYFTFWLHVWELIRQSNSTIKSVSMSHHCVSPAFISAGLGSLFCSVFAVERRRCSMFPTAVRAQQSFKLWAQSEVKTISTVSKSVVFQTGFPQLHSNSNHHDQRFPQTRNCLVDAWDNCSPASCCLQHHTALCTKTTATESSEALSFSTLPERMLLRKRCQATSPIPASQQSSDWKCIKSNKITTK